MLKEYKTVTEIAQEWGLKPRTVQIMCSEGKIPGVAKFGHSWAIPTDTERPKDKRETTGEYKNWRKKSVEE